MVQLEAKTAGNRELEKLLSGAQLPALPQSAIRLLQLSQDPKNGPAEFATPIEADPGLTGQVLKFVNSSYFGFSREISSVKLAITMVGIRTIKNFALWSAVFSLMPNPKCGPFDLKSLWQDSLRRGLFARAFGKQMGMREAEEPFAAALLQDMAIPLLAKAMPKEYLALLAEREGGDARLSELEQSQFGWNHGQAAAQMARQWNLPDAFATLVERHTDIESLAADSKTPPGELSVALSSLLPSSDTKTWKECARFESYFDRFRAAGSSTALELLDQVDREFADFAPILKLATPAQSLADYYRSAHPELSAPTA
jgi:HD-like signal output (HDOD) protein